MGKQAARIGAELRKAIADAIIMLALEIDRELRRATPVDTGHARRNWIASVGAPNTEQADSDSAHAQGIQRVLAYELIAGPVWITNVVPYIRALNYGHSKQRPAGFVERAVDLAMQTVQRKLAGKVDISGIHASFRSEVGGEAAGNLASAYSPFE